MNEKSFKIFFIRNKILKICFFFCLQQNFLDEFNTICEKGAAAKYPPTIYAKNLIRGHFYPMQAIIYLATMYHDKAVVARIIDEQGVLRSFFLPEAYGNKIREKFADPRDFECYQMYLVFSGFVDEINLKIPKIKIEYQGGAQL